MKHSPISRPSFSSIVHGFMVGFLLAFLVLTVLRQANPLTTKLGRDSGIYVYVSSSLLKGELPYVFAWETKPPGIFFLDAFALWIGQGTRWGVWLIEFLFMFATACIGFYTLYRLFGTTPATVGSMIWLFGCDLTLEGGNLTEEYSLLFAFVALLLWTLAENKRIPFWFDLGIGLCLGLGVLFRPNNIGVQLAILFAMTILLARDKKYSTLFTRWATIGFAALIPLVASALYFNAQGALREFFEASILYNISYTGGNFDLQTALRSGIGSLGFVGGFATVGYFIALGQLRLQSSKREINPFLLWLALNGCLEILLSALSGKGFQHYFICWLPMIASASAFLAHGVFPSFSRFFNERPAYLLLAALGLNLFFYPTVPGEYWQTYERLRYRRAEGIQRPDPIAEYVNAHTRPGDLALVWGGQAGINFLSERDSPTPYIFYPLFEPSKITDRISAEYYRALQETPPLLIVDGSFADPERIIPLDEESPLAWTARHGAYAIPFLVETLDFIRQNYSLIDIVSGAPIYKLNR